MTTEKKPKIESRYDRMYKHLETTNKNIQDWEFADLTGQDPKVVKAMKKLLKDRQRWLMQQLKNASQDI